MGAHQFRLRHRQLHRGPLHAHDPYPHQRARQQQHQYQRHDDLGGPPGQIGGGPYAHPGVDHQAGIIGIVVKHSPDPAVVLVHVVPLPAVRRQLLLQTPDPELDAHRLHDGHRAEQQAHAHAQPHMVQRQPQEQIEQPCGPGRHQPDLAPVVPPDAGEGHGPLAVGVHHLRPVPVQIPVA